MTAEILTIGDELLIGQVVNTNQAFLAEQLTLLGIDVKFMATAGDDEPAITRTFAESFTRADVVLVTGGLGPTHDDITKKALCSFFGCGIVVAEGLRAHIESLLRKRNLPWTDAAEEQVRVPAAAILLPNPVGTAPGMLFERGGHRLIALPGVPYEMREIMERSVLPLLREAMSGPLMVHRTLRTTGITESMLAQQLGDLDQILEGARLAFLPSPSGVRLRISVQEASREEAERRLTAVEARIRDRAGKHVYAAGEEDLEEVLGRLLTERRLRIAVAESCTGGRIADRLTNVSGSSAYFERGIVTYSNASKIELLGVPAVVIERHGAVSREVAEAMARGVRTVAHADIGLSTTGIAGPTGGTADKPVGTVWVGISDDDGTLALRFHLGDGRLRFKERASQAALELVRRRILRID
jgi:nicotinamide-nucleotide amidase